MDIEILPAGPFQTNTYLVINRKTKETVVIDAPPESWDLIQQEVQNKGLTIKALFITHPHWDHTLDVYRFREKNILVYAHSDAVEVIENPEIQAYMAIPGLKFIGAAVDHLLKHDDYLEMAGMRFEIREAPGHADGSLLFYMPDGSCCFTGDVIFDGSVGRTDFPGGSMETLIRSIRNQVYTLPDETILYPGHGSSTLVGKEKISNPFVTA